ncbi:uncharacterized protein LOC144170625 isoform X1 [Haemaphysalis longicornis]
MKSQRPDTGRGGSRGNWGEQRQQPRNMKPGNPEKRKVYVAGIGPDAKEDDIRQVFENYTVEHVYMRFEGEKKAHCFVVFSTEAEAQEVLQESFTLNNRPITVKAPTPKPDAGTANSSGSFRDQGPKEQSADKEKELFVANLPNNIEEGNLMTLFESYGVEKVVLKKPENRKPFAFLTLRDKAAVAAAVNEMNNHLFWGKKLSVALSGQKAGPPGTSGQPYRGSQNGSATPSESGAPDESWDKPLGPPVLSQPTGIVDSPPSDDPPPLSRVVADHGQGDGPPALVRPAGDGPPSLVRPAGDGPPAGGRASAASFNGPAPLYRMTNGAPLLDSPPALARISGQEPQGTTAHKQVHEVFVGNLRADTTEDEIRDIFAKYGVISIFMKGRPPKPVAFVGLESAASVESAIRDLDGNSVGTQTNLAVRKADGPKPKGKLPKAVASTVPSTGRDPFSNENKLFVANLPKQVTKDDVLQLFGKYGVRETFLISTKGTPYAFVTLTTEAGFNRAFEEMQGFMFRGCKLFMGLPASRDGDHGAHPGPKAAAPTTAAAAPAPASKLSSPVTLCVANFPPETKMTDIAELFSSWDPLEVVMGRIDPTGQHSYTHAYVTMPTWDEAEDAVFTLSETYFRERIITVAVLPEKCKRPY